MSDLVFFLGVNAGLLIYAIWRIDLLRSDIKDVKHKKD